MTKTFDVWFVSQFGKRPSKLTNTVLMLKTHDAEYAARSAKAIWEKCRVYEERKQAALLAWTASETWDDSKRRK